MGGVDFDCLHRGISLDGEVGGKDLRQNRL